MLVCLGEIWCGIKPMLAGAIAPASNAICFLSLQISSRNATSRLPKHRENSSNCPLAANGVGWVDWVDWADFLARRILNASMTKSLSQIRSSCACVFTESSNSFSPSLSNLIFNCGLDMGRLPSCNTMIRQQDAIAVEI
ncbi:MAG: hypothetical protein RMY36_032845 [Nostoc sp. SerVER01]|nr:hypothetical protein [Nostoc sp. SerVER01]